MSQHNPLHLIMEKLEHARGRWQGCDWSTRFGPLGLDLKGLRARQAHLLAEATSGQESECWAAASQWLRQVESNSRIAELAAVAAVKHLEVDELDAALQCIEVAVAAESQYHPSAIWLPLANLISDLCRDSLTNHHHG